MPKRDSRVMIERSNSSYRYMEIVTGWRTRASCKQFVRERWPNGAPAEVKISKKRNAQLQRYSERLR